MKPFGLVEMSENIVMVYGSKFDGKGQMLLVKITKERKLVIVSI